MQPRFVPPTPNCGHNASTFTHDVVRDMWLCVKCVISLGGLMPSCEGCGGPLPVQAAITRFASRVCARCQRDRRTARRLNNRSNTN